MEYPDSFFVPSQFYAIDDVYQNIADSKNTKYSFYSNPKVHL